MENNRADYNWEIEIIIKEIKKSAQRKIDSIIKTKKRGYKNGLW